MMAKTQSILYLTLDILAILLAILAVTYRKLTTDPEAAVAVYAFINKFSDEAEFNKNHHVYLTGAYRPVTEEVSNLPTEVISGAFPTDLEGLFLRVGPNPIPEKIAHGYHWFDGDGMLHSLRVKDGKALYSNAFVKTPNYQASKKHKGVVWVQLGELKGVIGLIKMLYTQFILSKAVHITDLEAGAANTAINFYNNKIVLGYEANLPFEIVWREDNSFESSGYLSYNQTLNYPFTAHPKKDPTDGRWYFNGYSIEGEGDSTMKYGKIYGETVEAYFSIPLKVPTFAHDMSITENYVLLYDSSIIFDKMEIFREGLFYRLDEQKPFRIGLVSKGATSAEGMKWFTFAQAFGVVHPLNAWEEPESQEIVIITPISTVFNGFDSKKLSKDKLSFRMAELRLNLVTLETKLTLLAEDDAVVEFPNVHPSYVGRKAKYGFAGEADQVSRHFEKIVKYELYPTLRVVGKISLPAEEGEHYVCGEPVVISRPVPAGLVAKKVDHSDVVYLAVFATNLQTLETEWIVYDGVTMSSTPVVRVRLGVGSGRMVPLGFHGLWIHEKELQQHIQLHQPLH